MKRFIQIIILLLFTSCTQIGDILPVTAPSIPQGLQEQIMGRINPEDELFSVGKASLTETGTLIAQAYATQNAKKLLKQKLKREVEIDFNSFLLDTDTYTRGLIKPVLNDLMSYTIDLSLKNSIQKGEWQGESSVYSLVAISRTEVLKLSKQVFSGYLSDVSGKLINIKDRIVGEN